LGVLLQWNFKSAFFKSKNGTFIQTNVGIFKTVLIIIFGEEFSRLDESSFGNFYWPIIFYDFLMVKILKNSFLSNDGSNKKMSLIKKMLRRVFGSICEGSR